VVFYLESPRSKNQRSPLRNRNQCLTYPRRFVMSNSSPLQGIQNGCTLLASRRRSKCYHSHDSIDSIPLLNRPLRQYCIYISTRFLFFIMALYTTPTIRNVYTTTSGLTFTISRLTLSVYLLLVLSVLFVSLVPLFFCISPIHSISKSQLDSLPPSLLLYRLGLSV